MTNGLYIVAALVMGVCLAMQPPINAAMAKIVDSPLLAACISITISFVLIVALWIGVSRAEVHTEQLRQLPWWILLGGIIGVIFVAGSLVVAPVLGVAPFFVFIVAGQLLGSTAIDQFGAFGMRVRNVNPLRLLGLVMVIVGSALVQGSND